MVDRSRLVGLIAAALIVASCADTATDPAAEETAPIAAEPTVNANEPLPLDEAVSDSVMAMLFQVFRESVESMNEDKKYVLQRLAMYDGMSVALSAYLAELTEAARKLDEREGADWEFRDSDLNGFPDLFEEIDGVPNLLRDDNGNGTPDLLEDSDGDGIPDPLGDDDEDTIANVVDHCPQQAGAATSHGCPAPPDATTGTTNLALVPSAVGTYGEVELITGFVPDPATFEMPAGGPIDLARALPDLGCVGWAHPHPDLRLHWTGTDLLQLYYLPTIPNVDTVLVVNDPSGNWTCQDDSYNTMHPTVTINLAQNGTHAIWVATYTQGAATRGTLHVTELADHHP